MCPIHQRPCTYRKTTPKWSLNLVNRHGVTLDNLSKNVICRNFLKLFACEPRPSFLKRLFLGHDLGSPQPFTHLSHTRAPYHLTSIFGRFSEVHFTWSDVKWIWRHQVAERTRYRGKSFWQAPNHPYIISSDVKIASCTLTALMRHSFTHGFLMEDDTHHHHVTERN